MKNHNSTFVVCIIKLITLIFLSYSSGFYAQQYSSEWYTTDNGLPQNSVKDIVKDRYGYIWLSTEQGALRYDGHTFVTYREMNIGNLHFRTFSGSTEKDSIMIYNEYNRDGLLIHKRKPVKLVSSHTKDGEFISGIFYTYYRKRNLPEPTPFGPYMICMRTSKYLFSKNAIVFLPAGASAVYIPMLFDPENMKDVFTIGETVFIKNPKTKAVISITCGKVSLCTLPLFSDPEAIVYWEQINRQVFLICKDIIYMIKYTGKKLSADRLLYYPGFGNHQFYAMYYDTGYKSLYLGSLTKGLQILKLLSFSCVKNNIPFAIPLFYTLLPYHHTKVITPDGFIFDTSRLVKKLPFSKDNSKYSMLYDENGNLICVKGNTLEIYHHRSFRKIRKRVFDFEIRQIFRSGGLYFLCTRIDNKDILMEFTDGTYAQTKRTFTMASTIDCIRRYNEDYLFVGCLDGLYLLDKQKGFLKKIEGTTGVKNICRTSEGNFWALSHAKGIFLIKGNTLLKMPVDADDNLASSHDLLEDRNGFLWISTNNGLYKVRKKNLLDHVQNPGAKVNYYRYSAKDGFNTNEFNGGGKPGAAALSDGHFVFPSMDGLVFFRPEAVPAPLPSGDYISVERVKIDDSIKSFRDTLMLEKDFDEATLYIDVPFYGHKENLIMEAQVDSSSEKKWIPVGEDRTFVIEKIASGSHVLNLRVLTDDGRYTYKRIAFYVQPYSYETTWFKALVTLVALAGTVFVICRLSKRFTRQKDTIETVKNQLEETEIMLEKESSYQESLFQAITHDIATPIKHLSNLSHMMLGTDNPSLHKKYFDSVYKSTEELYNLTLNLREYRQAFNSDEVFVKEEFPLRDIIEMKIRLFRDMASYNGTRIINHIPPDLLLNVSPSIIGIIFQNLLDNAVKNTVGGTITFNAYCEDQYIIIIISDTGSGMKEELVHYCNALFLSHNEQDMAYKHFGLGLQLVIRLVKKIHAEIKFANNQLQGTLVTLKIHNICSKKF